MKYVRLFVVGLGLLSSVLFSTAPASAEALSPRPSSPHPNYASICPNYDATAYPADQSVADGREYASVYIVWNCGDICCLTVWFYWGDGTMSPYTCNFLCTSGTTPTLTHLYPSESV